MTQLSFAFSGEVSPPLVLSYGMGVDSTAVLVLWWQMGIRPDLILFADTHSENPKTYAYRNVIDRFLEYANFPKINVVHYSPSHGHYEGLLQDNLVKGMLPSLAYGRKACSVKYKVAPQMDFIKKWGPAIACWSAGGKIRHAIGYDAGPKDSARGVTAGENHLEDYVYPLREAGWDRDRCIAEIAANPLIVRAASEVGVDPVPPKSACVFCPSTKPAEVDDMVANDRRSAILALLVESEALPNCRNIGGLWRQPTKARPASWNEYVGEEFTDAEKHAALQSLFSTAPPLECLSRAARAYRYCVVHPEGGHEFFTHFRDASKAAMQSGSLYFRIAGEWYMPRQEKVALTV